MQCAQIVYSFILQMFFFKRLGVGLNWGGVLDVLLDVFIYKYLHKKKYIRRAFWSNQKKPGYIIQHKQRGFMQIKLGLERKRGGEKAASSRRGEKQT